MELTTDLIVTINSCDIIFNQFDKKKDGQLEWSEFKNYVSKRAGSKDDEEEVMKQFKRIDVAGDGHIQFFEFLRAVCNEKN